MSEPGLVVTLPREVMARVAQWALEHHVDGPKAILQIIDRGLAAPEPERSRKRGQPRQWGDLLYMELYGNVSKILDELESKRKPYERRVTVEDAIGELRKRSPNRWQKYPQRSLVTRFYDAKKRIPQIKRDSDAWITKTYGNQWWQKQILAKQDELMRSADLG
jgi:hypothetical protein